MPNPSFTECLRERYGVFVPLAGVVEIFHVDYDEQGQAVLDPKGPIFRHSLIADFETGTAGGFDEHRLPHEFRGEAVHLLASGLFTAVELRAWRIVGRPQGAI